MTVVAAWLVGKRIKYRDLIAANGLPSGGAVMTRSVNYYANASLMSEV